jgi:hypothetical protein
MPGIVHETPVELLRSNPMLIAQLLAGVGLPGSDVAAATLAPADVGSALPAELRADAVVLTDGPAGRQAVVIEVQTGRDDGKRRVWPAYLTLARAQHECPALLMVICRDQSTGRWARQPIVTGHPGFDLVPLVVDAVSTPPLDSSAGRQALAEIAVLSAFTGAIDLEQDSGRMAALGAIAAAHLDAERLATYTHLVRAVASAEARTALEALMTVTFRDDFVDRYRAEGEAVGRAEGEAVGRAEGEAVGRAEGEAVGRAEGQRSMLLRILAARGFAVTEAQRAQIEACGDSDQLGAWADRAVVAASLEDVFSS